MGMKPTLIPVLTDPTVRGIPGEGEHMDDGSLVIGGAFGPGFVPLVPQDGRQQAGAQDAEYVSFSTVNPGEARVDHDLGRQPRRFTLVNTAGQVTLWRGTSIWTASSVFFAASANGVTVTVELA